MKIKSIKKVGERLFLITYAKKFWEKKEHQRFVIQKIELFKNYGDNINIRPSFIFRENGDIVFTRLGSEQLIWMVENKVDFFDNDEGLK